MHALGEKHSGLARVLESAGVKELHDIAGLKQSMQVQYLASEIFFTFWLSGWSLNGFVFALFCGARYNRSIVRGVERKQDLWSIALTFPLNTVYGNPPSFSCACSRPCLNKARVTLRAAWLCRRRQAKNTRRSLVASCYWLSVRARVIGEPRPLKVRAKISSLWLTRGRPHSPGPAIHLTQRAQNVPQNIPHVGQIRPRFMM